MRTRIINLWTGPGMQKGLFGLGMAAVLLLTGCASTGISVTNAGQSEQLAPVQSGNVQTSALPPIGPNGEVQGPSPLTPEATQTADAQPVANTPPASARDLSGGLTVEKLLGRWTIVSGQTQCQLNLTQTQKTGTSRYRASSPACGLNGLSNVASWALAGTQVQLFDEGGTLIAAMILSGNRFIGTLSGGTGISMVG